MEHDDHIVQRLGVEFQSKIEDLEFQIDKSVKMEALEVEIKLENDRGPECVKQETDMKVDIQLEDLTSNYEDLKVKIESENIKEEELILADVEEKLDCYMIETNLRRDNLVSNEMEVMEYNLKYDQSNYGGDLQKHLFCPEDLSQMENEESLENQMQAHNSSSQCKQKDCLNKHTLEHVDASKMKLIRCDRCIYKTRNANKFRKHSLLHKAERTFKCHECKYETKWKGNLKSHLKIHQPINLKCYSYQCEDTDHPKHSLHEAERMFKCNDCNYETRWKGNLKLHVRIHDVQTARPRNLKCGSCSYQCDDKDHLIKHMMEHKDPFWVKMF